MPQKTKSRNYLKSLLLIYTAAVLVSFTGTERIVNDFSLKDVTGRMVSMKDYPGAKGFVIVFTCNHCPFAKLYPQRLNGLYAKYTPLGVPVIAISSSDTVNYDEDMYPEMVAKAKEGHFVFPYLYDGAQSAARNFSAQKTPHAFVVWKEGGKWVVKYSGAIDDNGAEPAKVTHRYIEDAVEALLHGQPVAVKETKSIGCQIQFRTLKK